MATTHPHRVATVLILLYGNFHTIHCRCLESILGTLPNDTAVRIGLNEVCHETLRWLEKGALGGETLPTGVLESTNTYGGVPQGRIRYFSSKNENIKKYPMMRRMLWEFPLTSPWVVWFDDDSYISETHGDWWSELQRHDTISSHGYLGSRFVIGHMGRQWDLISSRPWFRNVAPQRVGSSRGPGIEFHTGGFFAVRTEILKTLAWPDTLLVHNGGDTLLAEAIRQQGLPMHNFPTQQLGIVVNGAKRRGYTETPAGV